MYDFDTSVGGANATSYPTLEDASNYLTARGNASSFFALDETAQEQKLIYGTGQLDLLSVYDGTVADRDTPQALGWPRVQAYDCEGLLQDSTTNPQGIKNAATELALYQTEADRLSTPALLGKGFKRAKVGPLEVETEVNMRFDLASRNVEVQLGCLGRLKGIASFNSVTNGTSRRA
jgi:hypothetical protein